MQRTTEELNKALSLCRMVSASSGKTVPRIVRSRYCGPAGDGASHLYYVYTEPNDGQHQIARVNAALAGDMGGLYNNAALWRDDGSLILFYELTY